MLRRRQSKTQLSTDQTVDRQSLEFKRESTPSCPTTLASTSHPMPELAPFAAPLHLAGQGANHTSDSRRQAPGISSTQTAFMCKLHAMDVKKCQSDRQPAPRCTTGPLRTCQQTFQRGPGSTHLTSPPEAAVVEQCRSSQRPAQLAPHRLATSLTIPPLPIRASVPRPPRPRGWSQRSAAVVVRHRHSPSRSSTGHHPKALLLLALLPNPNLKILLPHQLGSLLAWRPTAQEVLQLRRPPPSRGAEVLWRASWLLWPQLLWPPPQRTSEVEALCGAAWKARWLALVQAGRLERAPQSLQMLSRVVVPAHWHQTYHF
mmetsp:Transcript_38706/g.89693  ORF Transcript_38706/g.89693 Transcript_38706/m.89693 type:complete len:316 (-) Transcript_38706:2221-3168(-)